MARRKQWLEGNEEEAHRRRGKRSARRKMKYESVTRTL